MSGRRRYRERCSMCVYCVVCTRYTVPCTSLFLSASSFRYVWFMYTSTSSATCPKLVVPDNTYTYHYRGGDGVAWRNVDHAGHVRACTYPYYTVDFQSVLFRRHIVVSCVRWVYAYELPHTYIYGSGAHYTPSTCTRSNTRGDVLVCPQVRSPSSKADINYALHW